MVKRVLALGSGFEAPVYPKILVRHFAQGNLQQLIELPGICDVIALGEVLKYRSEAQGPGVVFNVACLMKHEHRRLIALGQTRTCRNSRRRYTEKRGEYRVLAAIVLICRIPYGAACFEAFDGLTHVAAFDNAVKVMSSPLRLQPLPGGVFVAPIHHVNKAEFAQELAGHINRRVVGTNQNNASALVVGLMQVLQSFHLVVGGQISFGVQPGQGHFDDPDARMAEVCPDEASLLLRVKRGKHLAILTSAMRRRERAR